MNRNREIERIRANGWGSIALSESAVDKSSYGNCRGANWLEPSPPTTHPISNNKMIEDFDFADQCNTLFRRYVHHPGKSFILVLQCLAENRKEKIYNFRPNQTVLFWQGAAVIVFFISSISFPTHRRKSWFKISNGNLCTHKILYKYNQCDFAFPLESLKNIWKHTFFHGILFELLKSTLQCSVSAKFQIRQEGRVCFHCKLSFWTSLLLVFAFMVLQ